MRSIASVRLLPTALLVAACTSGPMTFGAQRIVCDELNIQDAASEPGFPYSAVLTDSPNHEAMTLLLLLPDEDGEARVFSARQVVTTDEAARTYSGVFELGGVCIDARARGAEALPLTVRLTRLSDGKVLAEGTLPIVP